MKTNLYLRFFLMFAIAILTFQLFLKDIESNKKLSLSSNDDSRNYLKDQKSNKNAFGKDVWSQKKQRVKGVMKSDSPDKFAEIHTQLRTAADETKPSYEKNYRFKELEKAKSRNSLTKTTGNSAFLEPLNWIERGPANVGGRTRVVLVDTSDPTYQTWFAGAVGGGIWKTIDAGASWTPMSDDLPNLAITCMAISASNGDVFYAGTGEGFYNSDAIEGNGIMKSIDGGTTWFQLASTAEDGKFSFCNRLVIDPMDENIVVVATNSGTFKTNDGGITWIEKFSGGGRIQDLRANPENFNTLFAPTATGVIRSHDAGETWVLPEYASFGGGRIEIAPAITDTNRLYASVNSSPNKMYVTLDGGTSWREVEEIDGSDKNWLGAQGWYDNTIGVHPFDEDIVYMGGINLWKSNVSTDSALGIANIVDTDLDTLFTYTPSGLPERNGGIGTGKDFWNENVLINTELTDIEIRFGPDKSQKAHRYLNAGYTYQDYIDVPFEVWDITNNKQLMCGFQDVDRNGVYSMRSSRGDVIFVNNVDYDSAAASPELAVDLGNKYENSFVIAFRMVAGKVWDPENLPDFLLRIETGKIPSLTRQTVAISDAYGGYPTDTYVHPDHHDINMFVTNEGSQEFIFLNGNDGGVAVSYDAGASFDEVGDNGYNTTQFYGGDKSPSESRYFGGTQDNGTFESLIGVDADKTTEYYYRLGGDGFEVSWHYGDSQKMIGSLYFNRIYKTVDGWNTSYAANVGHSGWNNDAVSPFLTRIAKSYNFPDLLFSISTQGVYRSENFGDSWSLIPIPALEVGGNSGSAQVSISIAQPQIVWAGAVNTDLYLSKDGGLSFEPVSAYTEVTMGGLSGLDTHPIDEATAYATFSFSGKPKILRTTDYGQSWEDITGYGTGSVSTNGFPNVATYCVAVMPYNTDIIWAGTDIGLIESTDGGATWHLAESGLPQVSVWELRIVDDEVVAVTHGRGIWSVSLPELADHKPPVVTLAPSILSAKQVSSSIVVSAALRSAYDSTHVFVNNKLEVTVMNSSAVDTSISIPIDIYNTKSISLRSYKEGKTYKSANTELEVFQLLSPQTGYATDFESAEEEFIFEGLNISTNSGFSSSSINSSHPYQDQRDHIAVLKVPIIIASSDATLNYDDIAIVESGEPGTVFGDAQFWDYVIVEGNNGSDWIYLEDGYDARSYTDWLNAYNGGQSGTEAMYKSHSINLLDHFNPGDTVLFRFRLFADDNTNGWGWSIDNLVIQGAYVGVEDEVSIPKQYELSQNYPNPFNPSTKISFSLPTNSNVKLQVFNTLGELVTTLTDGTMNAGLHQVEWNAGNLASGVYLYRINAESVSSSQQFNSVKKMILIK